MVIYRLKVIIKIIIKSAILLYKSTTRSFLSEPVYTKKRSFDLRFSKKSHL